MGVGCRGWGLVEEKTSRRGKGQNLCIHELAQISTFTSLHFCKFKSLCLSLQASKGSDVVGFLKRNIYFSLFENVKLLQSQ